MAAKFQWTAPNVDPTKHIPQEVTHNMCKKIAHLTKVICSLNAKIEDNDLVIQAMKEAHEDKMQQLVAETRHKLAHYRAKFSRDTNLQQKQIETLERSIEELNKEKQHIIDEFEEFKSKANSNCCIEGNNSEKVNQLTKELEEARQNYEAHLQHCNHLQEQLRAAKDTTIETLQQAHLTAEQFIDEEDSERSSVLCELSDELKQWKTRCQELETNRAELQHKLELMSGQCALTEQELNTLRASQNSNSENEQQKWQEKERVFRQELDDQKNEYSRQLDILSGQLTNQSGENDKLDVQIKELQILVQEMTGKEQQLQLELDSAKAKVSELTLQVEELQSEINKMKLTIIQQAEELLNKTNAITSLEEVKNASDEYAKSIQKEQETLKQVLLNLETEKRNEIEQLKHEFEESAKEKKVLQVKFEKDFEFLRNCNAEREQKLMEDFEWKLREIEKTHKAKSDIEKKKNQERLTKLTEELERKFEKQKQSILMEKRELEINLETCQTETSNRTYLLETELKQLRGLTQELQKGMKVSMEQTDQMKITEIRLRDELQDTRIYLQDNKRIVQKLQCEICDLKERHEKAMRDLIERSKAKQEQVKNEIEEYWKENFRAECSRVQVDLETQYEDEKQIALETLQEKKDKEFVLLQDEYKQKNEELESQLETIRTALQSMEQKCQSLQDERSETEEKVASLELELQNKEDEADDQIAELEKQLEEIVELKNKEKANSEELLKLRHNEELQMQLAVHRAALDLVRDQLENERIQEVEKINSFHEIECENLKKEAEKKKLEALEEQTKVHKSQLKSVHQEVDRALNLAHQKEIQHQKYITELEEELRQREVQIQTLQEEAEVCHTKMHQMSIEMKHHGRQILESHKDNGQQLRCHEAEKKSNKEARPQDIASIIQLREVLLDRDRLIKRLQEERHFLIKKLENKNRSASPPLMTPPEAVVRRKKGHREPFLKRMSAPTLLMKLDQPLMNVESHTASQNNVDAVARTEDSPDNMNAIQEEMTASNDQQVKVFKKVNSPPVVPPRTYASILRYGSNENVTPIQASNGESNHESLVQQSTLQYQPDNQKNLQNSQFDGPVPQNPSQQQSREAAVAKIQIRPSWL